MVQRGEIEFLKSPNTLCKYNKLLRGVRLVIREGPILCLILSGDALTHYIEDRSVRLGSKRVRAKSVEIKNHIIIEMLNRACSC